MERMDFTLYAIDHFTPQEIENTGAELDDVKTTTIINIDRVRGDIGEPIYILKNGLTSGNHRSKYHHKGMAVDFYLMNNDFDTVYEVYKLLLEHHFKGIGLYYCKDTKYYTYHADTRRDYGFWTGVKSGLYQNWSYLSLVSDPADLL